MNNRRTTVPQSVRRAAWIGLACVALAAVHGAVWYGLSEDAKGRILDYGAEGDAQGPRVSHAGMRRSGYPFAVRWTLDDPGLAGRWTYGAVRLRGRTITLGYTLLAPSVLEFQSPELGAVAEGHPAGSLAVRAEQVSGRITRDGPDILTAAYEFGNMAVDGHGAAARGVGSIRVDTGAAQPERLLALVLDGVTTPHSERLSLTGSGRLELRGRLYGAVRDGSGSDLAAWRDAGGIIEIETIRANWQQSAVAFDGTAALDEQMRPLVAGVVMVRGYPAMVDRLVADGVIGHRDASVAKVALTLLARPADDGGPPVLRLPVTVQNGRIRVGPFVLGSVGSILR